LHNGEGCRTGELLPDELKHGLGILVAIGGILAEVGENRVTILVVADGAEKPLLGL
jgi:hypothetical protein